MRLAKNERSEVSESQISAESVLKFVRRTIPEAKRSGINKLRYYN